VFAVFPNPSATGIFNFVVKEDVLQWMDVSIFDALGQRVGGFFERNATVGSREIKLDGQASGIFFLVVRTEHGQETRRLVKR
jgi:hypothetical protein